jgi:hypothetical protein
LKSLQLIIFNYEMDLQFSEAEADTAINVDMMHFSSLYYCTKYWFIA